MKTIAKIGFVLALSILVSPSFGQEPPAKVTKEKQATPANGSKPKPRATLVKRNIPAKKMEAKKVQPAR